jgi:hypothetical protein
MRWKVIKQADLGVRNRVACRTKELHLLLEANIYY